MTSGRSASLGEAFPEFFARVPRITLHDPLAAFLGAPPDGLLQFGYADAVRCAGHSCPTVALAYVAALKGLRRLYPSGHPERGAILVELRSAAGEATAGVTGAVIGMITGAAGEGGFKGIGGRHARRALLRFGAPIEDELRLTRLDTGARVGVTTGAPPAPVEMRDLLERALGARAGDPERAAFAEAWQGRVARILLDSFEGEAPVRLRD